MQVKAFNPADIKDVVLCPRLAQVLQGVNEKRPLIEFYFLHKSAVNRDADGNYAYQIVAVEAWQQGFKLGEICSHIARDTKNGTERWFGVESPFIHKARGHKRNQLVSKEVGKTVKNAIDSLIKPTLETTAKEVRNNLTQMINHLEYKARQKFMNTLGLRYDSTFELCEYVFGTVTGRNPVPPKSLTATLETAEVEYAKTQVIANVKEHFDKPDGGYMIKLLPNLTWFCSPTSDLKRATVYQSLDSAPQFIQEKVTMLKLLDNAECAADIGVRFGDVAKTDPDDGCAFFVVGGETKVQ